MAAVSINLCGFLPGLAAALPAQDKTPAGRGREAGSARKTVTQEEAARKFLQAKLIEVLRQTAQESKQWEKKEVAAGVQVIAADLIWDVDADIARDLLVLAWETLSKIEYPKQARSRYRNYSKRASDRREVLYVAKRRDPDLARKWLEEMSVEKKDEGEGTAQGLFDDRSERSAVLLQMAEGMIKDNPGAAVDFAVESLRDGISFGLQHVLIMLQEKSFEHAEVVVRAALKRLATAGMNDPNELLVLYSYLYTPGRINSAGTGDNQGRRDIAVGRAPIAVKPAAQVNPALAAEFLLLASDLLTGAPLPSSTANPQATARAQINAIQYLMVRVQEVSQEKAALLAGRAQSLLADARFTAEPANPPDGHLETLRGEKPAEYNERRIDYLEKLAEKETGGLQRDIAFARAAVATEPTSYERGWQLAGRIGDKEFRRDVANWITYRATLHFLEKNDLAKAETLNHKNADAAQRAVCLIVGAQKQVVAKNNARARESLSEASDLLKKAEPDENWTKIALGVVAAYGKFDQTAALDALQDAVKVLNQSPLDTAGQTDLAPAIRRFTGIIPAETTVATSGFSFNSALAGFRAQDFDAVYNALKKVEAPEARGVAIVNACQHFFKVSGNKSKADLKVAAQ
ncbi:MAG TPA: hypothetical protein VEY11_02710 [Pyrinomonadaceae bacterium]|nr:hypothetical protein [Pyrinomonadaceae bacterium]